MELLRTCIHRDILSIDTRLPRRGFPLCRSPNRNKILLQMQQSYFLFSPLFH
jgi:hypothetical protein